MASNDAFWDEPVGVTPSSARFTNPNLTEMFMKPANRRSTTVTFNITFNAILIVPSLFENAET
jgi:hypothetical protein